MYAENNQEVRVTAQITTRTDEVTEVFQMSGDFTYAEFFVMVLGKIAELERLGYKIMSIDIHLGGKNG